MFLFCFFISAADAVVSESAEVRAAPEVSTEEVSTEEVTPAGLEQTSSQKGERQKTHRWSRLIIK